MITTLNLYVITYNGKIPYTVRIPPHLPAYTHPHIIRSYAHKYTHTHGIYYELKTIIITDVKTNQEVMAHWRYL